jgi:hypothetical protein
VGRRISRFCTNTISGQAPSKAMTIKSVIIDMEMHCNNYFNSKNDQADPTRNYPPTFLMLAERILEFRLENKPSNVVSEGEGVVGSDSWNVKYATDAHGNTASWQQVFASDLSVFKRARFI